MYRLCRRNVEGKTCRYKKLARNVREVARKIKEIDPGHPFRTEASARLLEKL